MSNEVSNAFSKIVSTLQNSAFYAPWYRITIGNYDNPDLVLCTDDPNSNYIVSLENRKNGAGLCNSFTIIIAWRPTVTEDINRIDKILSKSGLVADLSQFSMQYGYAFPYSTIRTPVYRGIITNYSLEIRNGFLMYTLTGYSSLSKFNDRIINVDVSDDATTQKPTEVVQAVFNKFMESVDDEDLKYKFVDPDNALGTDKEVDLEVAGLSKSRTTLIQWINSVLDLAVDSTQDETTSPIDKYIYTFEIDDTKMPKEFILRKLSTKDGVSSAETISTVFNWMDCTPNGGFNLITEFRPSFDGSVLMAYKEQSSDESSTPTYGIKSDGSITFDAPTKSSNDLLVGDQVLADNSALSNAWAKLIQEYSYTAQMSTVGIPVDIPLLTKFQIRPLINNQEHHAAGTYILRSMYDRIDSAGFTSNYELLKLNMEGTN